MSSERGDRIVEVVASVAASAIASALVALWVLSSTLSEFRTKIAEHDSILNSQQAQMQTIGARAGTQAEQLAASSAHWQDVVMRLDSIDRKLDGRR